MFGQSATFVPTSEIHISTASGRVSRGSAATAIEGSCSFNLG